MNASNFRGVPAGELCDLIANGVTVEMFRSAGYTGPREGTRGFRPCTVKKDGKTLWDFRTCGANTRNGDFADLYELDGELVIAVQNGAEIFSVLSVNDFTKGQLTLFRGKQIFIGGSSPEKTLSLKKKIAGIMRKSVKKTSSEEESEEMIEAENARKKAERNEQLLAERKAVEAKRQADLKAREDRRLAIQSRPKVSAWSASGHHFSGTPVEGTEWQSLAHEARAIEMKEGKPISAFIVQKTGSRTFKIREVEVTGTQPMVKTTKKGTDAGLPEVVGQMTAELKGQTKAFWIVEKMEDLKAFRASGLNGHTWVGYRKPGTTEVQVYEFREHGTESEFLSIGVVRQPA